MKRVSAYFLCIVTVLTLWAITPSTANLQAAGLDESLVMRMRFDGGFDVEPESIPVGIENRNNISFTDDAVDGQAMDLSLADDDPISLNGPDIHYLQVIRPPEVENHCTISFWFKSSEGRIPPHHRGLFSWGARQNFGMESHGLGIVNNGNFHVWINSHSEKGWHAEVSPGVADISEWTHLAYTFSTQTQEIGLFLNGNQVLKQPYRGDIEVPGLPLFIGANPWGNFEVFHGYVDDWRLYDRALNQTEVLELYQEFKPPVSHPEPDENGLVLRLKFDGDSEAEPDSYFTAENHPRGIKYSDDAIDGMALDLQDENGPYVMVIRPPEIENHFTISMWMKLPEGNPEALRGVFSWGPVSGVEGEAHGFFVSEFQRFLTIQNFGSTSNTGHEAMIGNVDVSQWNHIAYTYSVVRGIPRGEHKLFVNGKPMIATRNAKPIVTQGHNILIGVNPVGGYEVFPGLIDDFRLYNRPLTQEEVQALIDEQIPKLSIQRIDQGRILTISNPKKQILEVLATGDFLSWESAYETGNSGAVEFFFDNQHQADPHRFYHMRPKVR